MATTTMHFGPEWMRKQATAATRSSQADFHHGGTTSISGLNPTVPTPQSSSCSASVSSVPPSFEKRDGGHLLRYSKEEMIRIYREGVNSALGPGVERWEGIIREIAADPIGTKEMTDVEKRLFSGPLNSEVRRRQSTSDYLSPLSTSGLDRPKLGRDGSNGTSPMRERFGSFLGARRRESGDHPTLGAPRKHSISSLQQPLVSPRDSVPPSSRSRNGPGFDGVLGSGETWNMRRRGSETRPRIGGSATRDPGGLSEQVDEMSEMRSRDGVQESDRSDKPTISDKARMTQSSPYRHQQDDGTVQRTEAGHAQSQNQLIDDSGQQNLSDIPLTTMTPSDATTATAPNQSPVPGVPGTTDLAAIEWSYLDTQEVVQGPFRADVMQSWHDQGYFTSDLLMKRTQIDTDWISVGELSQRAVGPKIFLSPVTTLAPPGPPGLTKRLDNMNDPLLRPRDPSPFGAPHQPVPIRSLRTSTLDSYINGNSQSASPSSSAGPTSNIFGNPEPSINAIGANRRSYVDASMEGLGRSSYSNTTASYGFNDVHRENILGHHPQSGLGPHQPELSFSTSTALAQSPFLPATPPVQLHQNNPTNIVQPASPSVPHLPAHNYTPSASPWGTPDLSLKRVGMFDATYQPPRQTNPPAQPRQPSPWERSTRAPWSAVPSEHSSDGWSTGDGTSSLTVSNLEQHNQQQLRPEPILPVLPEAVPVTTDSKLHAPGVPQQDVLVVQLPADVPPVTRDEILETPTTKPRKKSASPTKGTISQSQPQQQVQQQPSKPQVTSVSTHPPAVKTVWSKDDDGKKPSGVSIGFREIQEAEAKQSEARKAALERERATAANRNVGTPAEDSTMPTTTSWGLPTSQVQASRKEPVSAGSPTAAAPVWTNVVKPPAAKTMKEIQEEERRRKVEQQQTQEKETVNVPARRSHAEAVSKAPAVTPSPAWTTVGSNGKTSITSQHVRPVVAATSSTPSVAMRPLANGATSSRPPVPAKVVTAVVKNEDAAVHPSLDFLKWLTDSLKGLNQSANLEDITSMLLSFPLDPDPTTLEIISDLIYASSTTLDGRRFAAEFVSKRKADAAARPRGNSSAIVPGKVQSIADVVKTQPKPAQNEWGFKVVNKKRKGGRS